MLKKIGVVLLGLVAIALLGAGYLILRKPAMAEPANIKVDMSPERIARGKYLFTLADCSGCHSPHNWKLQDGPTLEGKVASGQDMGHMEGLDIRVPNITPDRETGIGSWTDGEKIRAIREGIGKHGNVLFPMMPYSSYRHMSDDDVQSLVAYLNTLAPVRNELARLEPPMFLKVMIKGVPKPVTEKVETPKPSSGRLYGEYLVTIGSCEKCHTKAERGRPVAGMQFAGGQVFATMVGTVVSANITPDKDTGIGNWTRDYFKQRITMHKEQLEKGLQPVGPEKFTVMPWLMISQLPESDWDALYDYLMQQVPVTNKVDTHPVQVAQR